MMKVKDELPIASKPKDDRTEGAKGLRPEPIEPVSSTESLTLHKEPIKRSNSP